MLQMDGQMGKYLGSTPIKNENQSTESTDGDGCIYACKSSNREIFSLIPIVQPAI